MHLRFPSWQRSLVVLAIVLPQAQRQVGTLASAQSGRAAQHAPLPPHRDCALHDASVGGGRGARDRQLAGGLHRRGDTIGKVVILNACTCEGGGGATKHASCEARGIGPLPLLRVLPGQGRSSGISLPCAAANPAALLILKSRHPTALARTEESSTAGRPPPELQVAQVFKIIAVLPSMCPGVAGKPKPTQVPAEAARRPSRRSRVDPSAGCGEETWSTAEMQDSRRRSRGLGAGGRVCNVGACRPLAMMPTHSRLARTNMQLCTHWPAPGST